MYFNRECTYFTLCAAWCTILTNCLWNVLYNCHKAKFRATGYYWWRTCTSENRPSAIAPIKKCSEAVKLLLIVIKSLNHTNTLNRWQKNRFYNIHKLLLNFCVQPSGTEQCKVLSHKLSLINNPWICTSEIWHLSNI